MKDRVILLCTGVLCAMLAWASWHFVGASMAMPVMALWLIVYAVDNYQLRRQVRSLLADRDRREQRGKADARRHLLRGLLAVRDKRDAES
jgi:hypothetical protein